jgi:hypothetical protein
VVVDAEVPQTEQDDLDLRGHDLLMRRPGFGRGIRGGRRGRGTLLFLWFLLLARAAASSPKRREKAEGFAPKAQEAEGDGERGRRRPDLHLSGEEEEGGRQEQRQPRLERRHLGDEGADGDDASAKERRMTTSWSSKQGEFWPRLTCPH